MELNDQSLPRYVEENYLEKEIIKYYDECYSDYKLVWHLASRYSMHYGYWENDTQRLRQALLNMNYKVAELANLNNGETVLDAGCGVGGTSVFIADKYDCNVHGITLSKQQVSHAYRLSQKHKLSNRLQFSVQNFCNTQFPDNHFDVVVAIESVCHAEKKELFLKEAYRILKKGGRLVVADFFRTKPIFDTEDEQLIRNWAESWAVPNFEEESNFINAAKGEGFGTVSSKNITDYILPSAKRLYYYFVPGIICHRILSAFGKRNLIHKKNVWSTYYQYQSLKRNLWNYHLIQSIK